MIVFLPASIATGESTNQRLTFPLGLLTIKVRRPAGNVKEKMQAAKMQIVIWFFLIVSTLAVYRVISAKSDLHILAQSGVKEEVLAFIRKQNADLLSDKTKLQREEISLKMIQLKKYQAKAQLDLERVKLYSDIYLYGVIFLVGSTGLSGVIFVTAIHRERVKRASVHVYKIGASEIVVHERDLGMAAPVALGLVNAEIAGRTTEGLKTAIDLCKDVASIQHKQFAAIAETALPEQPVIDVPVRVPTFRDLLESGEIARGKPMILAEYAGELLRGSWLDLFSCAVGGQAGSGKTGTLRSYVAQSVLQGYQAWIIDPHYPHPESLQASLQPFIDQGLVKVGLSVEICEEVNRTIDDRLVLRESSRVPAILVIDEVLDVMTNCPGAAQTIEKIGTQGRKCQVYGLFAGHSWLAAKTGGNSALRDNLTAKIVHHMEKKQAKVLIDDAETAKQAQKLKPGEAFLKVIGKEPMAVKIHECVPADVFRVAELLKVADGKNDKSVNNSQGVLQVDIIPKKQTSHVVSDVVSLPVSSPVSESETPICLKSETPLKTLGTPSRTLVMEYMSKNRKTREEMANLLGVSLSMVKEVLAGRKKLTTERKMKLG
jgi:hypothetical protein